MNCNVATIDLSAHFPKFQFAIDNFRPKIDISYRPLSKSPCSPMNSTDFRILNVFQSFKPKFLSGILSGGKQVCEGITVKNNPFWSTLRKFKLFWIGNFPNFAHFRTLAFQVRFGKFTIFFSKKMQLTGFKFVWIENHELFNDRTNISPEVKNFKFTFPSKLFLRDFFLSIVSKLSITLKN